CHYTDTAPTQLYTLSLHDALPISPAADEPFRPEAGKFPPLEMAHSYRGELVFVDHANRRGSIRVQGTGAFRRNDPQPFAMLPYGDRKSTRLNSSHDQISYAVFCLK